MRYESLFALAACALPCVLLPACSAAPAEATGELGASAGASALGAAGATITFAADWTQTASQPLVAGQPVTLAYDAARLPACRGDISTGHPGWSIAAFYSLNGGAPASIAVAGAGLSNGPNPPTFTLPAASGDLAFWFQVTSAWGCMAYDSRFGANYHFPVAAAAPPAGAPGWVGNASYVVDRATCGTPPGPCYADAHPAEGGFSFDTWARQRAAITQVFFDVWKQGVTDFDNANLWKQLDVEMHARIGDGAAFTTSYVAFSQRLGNNARYAVDLRAIDPLGGVHGSTLTDKSQCPTFPVTVSADGQYVQADFQFYFTVNGTELRPAGGGVFHGQYQDYLGLYAVCGFGG